MSESFPRAFYVSLAGHAAVFALLFLRAVLIPDEPIQIRNVIRVDMVGLPEKSQTLTPPAPPPKVESKPEPKSEARPEPTPVKPAEPKPAAPSVNLNKNKKPDVKESQKKALDRLKAMDALEKIASEESKAAAKPAPVKGNQLAAGNALTGLEKIEFDRYFDDLKTQILNHWALPQWLADAGLKASVQVWIDDKGFVTKKVIRRSSGNDVFDAKAIEAVEASSPLPAPPSRIRGALATKGIVFNFPE